MIQDARVLEDDFLPREVAHRDPEMNELAAPLAPLTDGTPGETTFLFGPSGAGKTCIARASVRRLRRQALDLDAHYVNCWRHYTRFGALYQVLDGIDETLNIHRRSTPTGELLDRLGDYDGQYLVILDEIDQLEEPDLLYDLHSIRNLTMVLIANRETEVFSELDDRVMSRLQGAPKIRFDQYSSSELVAILSDRVRWGLRDDAVDEDVLRTIADKAAGDARVAINTLRRAARAAQQDGRERIPATLVTDAVPQAKQDIRQRSLGKLTADQQVIRQIIINAGPVSMGTLYEAYCDRVDDPKTKRGVRNDLQKLTRYELIDKEGENRGRQYRAPEQPASVEG